MQQLKQANDLSITERIQRLRMLMAQETSDHAQELRESTSEKEARQTPLSVPSVETRFWASFGDNLVIPHPG